MVRSLKRNFKLTKGMKGVIEGSIPVGGISSSAALLCGFTLVLAHVNNITLSDFEIIRYASCAEIEYIGLKNGILDQGCVVLSLPEKLLRLNTKTEEY